MRDKRMCRFCIAQMSGENPLKMAILMTLLSGLLLHTSLIPLAVADDDFTLQVFGNANMDDRIDEGDLDYAQGIVNKNNEPTVFADANYDSRIDEADIDQIKKMIAGTEESLTIRDAQNRNVTLTLPIEKADVVNSCAIEIMRAIGVDIEKVLVAATSYSTTNPDYLPELNGKFIHKWGSPDYEKLAIIEPDLVISYKDPSKDESISKYEAIGVPIIFLDCFNKQSLDGDVRVLGEIFKQREKAQELMDWYHGYIDLIKERTDRLDSSERPKTMFYSNSDYFYPIIKVRNENSGVHWIIEDAGGDNLGWGLNSTTGVAEVDREWVMFQDPDVIVGNINQAFNKSGYSANETLAVEYMRTAYEKIASDEAINQTKAATNGRIYLICNDLNAGPMQAAGTVFMAKILHPELFADLDPEAVLKEYLEKWQGVPYRGVWIYPSLD
jgi:iron complex transport system substrate-binding protein